MANKRRDSEFRHPDTVAQIQALTDEEAAKHSPIVRERDGVFTRYWRIGRRVRCREVEASGDPASARVGECLETPVRLTIDVSGPSSATSSTGHKHARALRSVAYRLLTVICKMVETGQTFDPDRRPKGAA